MVIKTIEEEMLNEIDKECRKELIYYEEICFLGISEDWEEPNYFD